MELESLLSEAVHCKRFTADCRGTVDTRGLCFTRSKLRKDTPQAEERAQILGIFGELEERKGYLHCLRLEQDCEWVHWDDVLEQDRDWKAALNLESDVLWKFKLSATEDQLPTQTMLKRWNCVKKDTCHVCGAAAGSLSHILSRCSRSLNQGRYTWRHDSILLAIYETVREVVNRANARVKRGISRPQKESISFISGSSLQSDSEVKTEAKSVKWKTATAPSSLASVLEQSDDWVLQVDLTIPGDGQKKNTPFPAHIGDGESAFSSRPDLIIFSDKLKHILYIELTSPWEGPRMEESHKEKMEKYRTAGLHSIPGWSTTPLCVEVGARGTTSNTFHRMCKALGMSSRESKRLGKKARTVAARCSYFIFLSRKVTEWNPRRPYVRC